MLNRDKDRIFDRVIIGKNYPSLLYSIQGVNRGHTTLLVDDERVSLGEDHHQYIGFLEREILELIGRYEDIPILKNLEDYLSRKRIVLQIGSRQLALGAGPFANLFEIARKFPELLSADICSEITCINQDLKKIKEFENDFFTFIGKLSSFIFETKVIDRKGINKVIELMPVFLKKVFNCLKVWGHEKFQNSDNYLQSKSLLFALNMTFLRNSVPTTSDFEFIHLFSSLLSPFYKMETLKIENELMIHLKEKGGEFRDHSIKECIFDQEKISVLELDHFDGLVYPKELTFFGSVDELPVEKHSLSKQYLGLELELELDTFFPHNDQLLFCSKDSIGSDYPFLCIRYKNKKVYVKVYVEKRLGLKENFIKRDLLELVSRSLRNYLGDDIELNLDGPLKISNNLLGASRKPSNMPENKAYFFDGKGKRVKNIKIIGPESGCGESFLKILLQIEGAFR